MLHVTYVNGMFLKGFLHKQILFYEEIIDDMEVKSTKTEIRQQSSVETWNTQ